MKGYTIQNSIDLLEKNGGGSGGASSAADVSFDNTGTGLSGTNVQSVIEEVDTKITNMETYSTTETLIGTYLGEPLYRMVISFNESLVVTMNAAWVDTGVTLDFIKELTRLTCLGGVNGFVWNILSGFINSNKLTLTSVVNGGSGTAGVKEVVLEYTKVAATTTKTRKKK